MGYNEVVMRLNPPVCVFVAIVFVSCFSSLLSPAFAGSPPSVNITIDDSVVTTLLKLIQTHDDSSASIDAWINLPGNAELLKIGALEHALTRDELRANVKAVIDGTATTETQPKYAMGRLMVSPTSDYAAMIDELHKREDGWLQTCQDRDELYSPDGITINQTVYLHLGGDWDAINRDGAIFINMHFFHDYFTPSWFGLNLLIAHETFHAVQNRAFGNVESTDSPDLAFFTALSKIQREGTARLVEVETDTDGYSPGTYGFYFRAVDNESIRQFAAALPIVNGITDACYPAYDADQFAKTLASGLDSGGLYYTIGEGMAQAIEKYDGRRRLIQTVSNGPLDFFDCYAQVARKHSDDLPPLPDATYRHVETLRSELKKERLSVPAEPPNSKPANVPDLPLQK